jgi:hypothetical protein
MRPRPRASTRSAPLACPRRHRARSPLRAALAGILSATLALPVQRRTTHRRFSTHQPRADQRISAHQPRDRPAPPADPATTTARPPTPRQQPAANPRAGDRSSRGPAPVSRRAGPLQRRRIPRGRARLRGLPRRRALARGRLQRGPRPRPRRRSRRDPDLVSPLPRESPAATPTRAIRWRSSAPGSSAPGSASSRCASTTPRACASSGSTAPSWPPTPSRLLLEPGRVALRFIGERPDQIVDISSEVPAGGPTTIHFPGFSQRPRAPARSPARHGHAPARARRRPAHAPPPSHAARPVLGRRRPHRRRRAHGRRARRTHPPRPQRLRDRLRAHGPDRTTTPPTRPRSSAPSIFASPPT